MYRAEFAGNCGTCVSVTHTHFASTETLRGMFLSPGSIRFSVQLPSPRSVLQMGGTASSWLIAAVSARGSSPPLSTSLCIS